MSSHAGPSGHGSHYLYTFKTNPLQVRVVESLVRQHLWNKPLGLSSSVLVLRTVGIGKNISHLSLNREEYICFNNLDCRRSSASLTYSPRNKRLSFIFKMADKPANRGTVESPFPSFEILF